MQRFLVLMLLLAASTISLTGCGNKGPLYLPQAPVQQISTPAEVPEEVSVEVSEETVESEDSSEDSSEGSPEDTPEDSPENMEAAEEPETTEAD